MGFEDWEARRINETLRDMHYRNKGKVRCGVCHYYLCTCQSLLTDFGVVIRKEVKDVSPAHNCPHNCDNSTKECVGCYAYDKFKMMVRL